MASSPNVAPHADYTCAWCGATGPGDALSCPSCGAAVDIRLRVTEAGWTELPAIADMTRIQFGHSTCQIEGSYVPVADMTLAEGDGVYFNHHVLLWFEPGVVVRGMSLKGAWKRLRAGLPLIMTEAHGPGRLAFSADAPGEVVALPLQPGQSVDVREHVLLVATSQVAYDWFTSGIWFTTGSGDDRETHYPLGQQMDRFTAPSAPGLLLLHGAGNVFVRQLAAGETVLVKPTSLLFKDSGVEMQLHIESARQNSSSFFTRIQRHVWVRLTGPGRVAVQSAFEHFHDEGNRVTNSPNSTTTRQW
jgi:uncharacterized protein (AIM24 family)